MRQLLLLIAALAALAFAEDEPAVDCAKMTVKKLRTWLHERGLKCEVCAEQAE